MELNDDRLLRPRRAAAGNLLQDLLVHGLDQEEEAVLAAYDGESSDSSFLVSSDEETVDEVDSDFSAEELSGVLEDEDVEDDATIRREERREKAAEKKKKMAKAYGVRSIPARKNISFDGERNDKERMEESTRTEDAKKKKRKEDRRGTALQRVGRRDQEEEEEDEEEEEEDDKSRKETPVQPFHAPPARRRPAPTIPWEKRMADALARAKVVKAALHEEEEERAASLSLLPSLPVGASLSSFLSFSASAHTAGASSRRRRRRRGGGGEEESETHPFFAFSSSPSPPSWVKSGKGSPASGSRVEKNSPWYRWSNPRSRIPVYGASLLALDFYPQVRAASLFSTMVDKAWRDVHVVNGHLRSTYSAEWLALLSRGFSSSSSLTNNTKKKKKKSSRGASTWAEEEERDRGSGERSRSRCSSSSSDSSSSSSGSSRSSSTSSSDGDKGARDGRRSREDFKMDGIAASHKAPPHIPPCTPFGKRSIKEEEEENKSHDDDDEDRKQRSGAERATRKRRRGSRGSPEKKTTPKSEKKTKKEKKKRNMARGDEWWWWEEEMEEDEDGGGRKAGGGGGGRSFALALSSPVSLSSSSSLYTTPFPHLPYPAYFHPSYRSWKHFKRRCLRPHSLSSVPSLSSPFLEAPPPPAPPILNASQGGRGRGNEKKRGRGRGRGRGGGGGDTIGSAVAFSSPSPRGGGETGEVALLHSQRPTTTTHPSSGSHGLLPTSMVRLRVPPLPPSPASYASLLFFEGDDGVISQYDYRTNFLYSCGRLPPPEGGRTSGTAVRTGNEYCLGQRVTVHQSQKIKDFTHGSSHTIITFSEGLPPCFSP